eukprot:TRINITY_DN8571_c0_g1_i2.p2 TRINITY_DN8571_c0_g1~~TRINITY_DN8571_c0_g1_i2.p2  ORF type:complete len:107 (+),score=20.67 TRINITY_DN8571_c0_g1_i2:347-667(+)
MLHESFTHTHQKRPWMCAWRKGDVWNGASIDPTVKVLCCDAEKDESAEENEKTNTRCVVFGWSSVAGNERRLVDGDVVDKVHLMDACKTLARDFDEKLGIEKYAHQ